MKDLGVAQKFNLYQKTNKPILDYNAELQRSLKAVSDVLPVHPDFKFYRKAQNRCTPFWKDLLKGKLQKSTNTVRNIDKKKMLFSHNLTCDALNYLSNNNNIVVSDLESRPETPLSLLFLKMTEV